MKRFRSMRSFIYNLIIFVFILGAFISGIEWILRGSVSWSIMFYSYLYTAFCTLFCTVLLTNLYTHIKKLPRILFFISFVAVVCAGVMLGLLTGNLIAAGTLYIDRGNMLFSLLFGLAASIIMTSYTVLRENLEEKAVSLQKTQLEIERLKRVESEARLASLQAKLDPHFLFNTLNSLASLVYDDPKKTEDSIVRLSELYRNVLSVSQRTMVHVRDELKVVIDYFELQKLRFGRQLEYAIECDDSLMEAELPGLIIEPLAGNIVKHALQHTDKAVRAVVRISAVNGNLLIEVQDNGPGFNTEQVQPGYGLASITERLGLVYGSGYTFGIDSTPHKETCVRMSFPLERKDGA